LYHILAHRIRENTREPPTINHTIPVIWLANVYNGEFSPDGTNILSIDGRTIPEVIGRNISTNVERPMTIPIRRQLRKSYPLRSGDMGIVNPPADPTKVPMIICKNNPTYCAPTKLVDEGPNNADPITA
jgi:hypothetical protein